LKNTNKFIETMTKKVLVASVALFLIAMTYSSCKSHETCPAYGKANTTKNIPA